MRFKDRTAVVAGGGSGIGQATALALADEGARVVIADVDVKMATETQEKIVAAGGQCLTVIRDKTTKPQNCKTTKMLKNKAIVIVGGTSGMGLSAALAFVKAGAKVVAVGLDEASCKQTEQLLGQKGSVLMADARQPETADTAIQHCLNQFDGFDGLYHVAGGSGRKWGDGPLHEITMEAWNQTLELNLTSIMLSNQAAVRKFLDRGTNGTILNLTSVVAFSPSTHYFYTHAYTAAKSAIIGFSKSVAAYYAKENIRVNVLAPAFTVTPMSQRGQTREDIMAFIKTKQPLRGGGPARAQDLDGLACYFMSDQSSFTTGQVVAVDGGWSVSEGQYS